MRQASLGDQEWALLQHVATHGPLTVAQAVETFGIAQGLARSTIVTMLERLRKKGYLTRSRQEGVFHYASPVAPDELQGRLVQRFVETTLGGSLAPFVSYFARAGQLSDAERAELERLIAKLQHRGGKEEAS